MTIYSGPPSATSGSKTRPTREQLAHEAGLHRTVVGFIERGEREVGIAKLWPLAAALGVPVSALFE
jgi:transcriptional regulator with XRE-family HTH domain